MCYDKKEFLVERKLRLVKRESTRYSSDSSSKSKSIQELYSPLTKSIASLVIQSIHYYDSTIKTSAVEDISNILINRDGYRRSQWSSEVNEQKSIRIKSIVSNLFTKKSMRSDSVRRSKSSKKSLLSPESVKKSIEKLYESKSRATNKDKSSINDSITDQNKSMKVSTIPPPRTLPSLPLPSPTHFIEMEKV